MRIYLLIDGIVCVCVSTYTHNNKYLKHQMNLKLLEGLKNFSIYTINNWNGVKGFVIDQILLQKLRFINVAM